MTLVERAKYYYSEKMKNCAEAILLASSDVYELGLTEEDSKLLVGFGGGMGLGSTCGALAGSIAVLGKIFSERADFRLICSNFVRSFIQKENCGSSDCSAIAPKYKNAETRCEPAVVLCAELLDEFIRKLL